ncbi:MAG: signal transduction histidine kinase [Chthonomonadaceae bacterium]|nr:signal transduction histidine kinase [Chthonomonadaceae bacterium]
MQKDSSFDIRNAGQEGTENELEALRRRLAEAEETLYAIRHGEVDALLVSGPNGAQVFTLESAEQPYRVLIEQMQEGAVTLAADGTILYCNLRFAQMLRRPHEKLLASSVQRLVEPRQRKEFGDLLHQAADGSARAEITFRAGDGAFLSTFVTVSALPDEVEGCLCMVVTDLTEQQSMLRSQAEISALNMRLQRAMTETHHRVKNSLQVITALVDLQLAENEDVVPAEKLRQLNLQVRTLATVHDVLTQQSKEDAEGSMISAKLLLGQLIPMLQQIAVPRLITYSVDDARLRAQQGVSLSLIVNELVLNALKHGQGDVEVTFRVDGTEACLEVCDDGKGLPDAFDPEAQASTGIYLVENLAAMDLRGVARYENRPGRQGARIVVTFPIGSRDE